MLKKEVSMSLSSLSLFLLSRCISFVSGASVRCALVGSDMFACLSVSLPSFGAERKKCRSLPERLGQLYRVSSPGIRVSMVYCAHTCTHACTHVHPLPMQPRGSRWEPLACGSNTERAGEVPRNTRGRQRQSWQVCGGPKGMWWGESGLRSQWAESGVKMLLML